MAEAAYAAGPALFWAPRLLSSIFPPSFLFPVSSRSPNSALVRNPKEPKSPRTEREAPKSGAANGFLCSLFHCFSAGPQRDQGPQQTSGPKI